MWIEKRKYFKERHWRRRANNKFSRLRDILRIRSGRIVMGKRDYSHAAARGCGTTRAHAYVYVCEMYAYMCLRDMELCNGYRFWTLESRLMNTKHVNSRGKSVEWAPSFSFGRCLCSIEEADVSEKPGSLRPFTRKTTMHESTSVNSFALAVGPPRKNCRRR